MTTIRELVTRSLKLIEEVGAGETASSESAFDGLKSLITMIDSWSIQNKLVYTETRENFALTVGDNAYTIGTGADFNTVRPIQITSAFITIAGADVPMDIIGSAQYAEIQYKTMRGTPMQMYYDANYPQGNILLYPSPSQPMSLNLYSKKPLTNFTSLDDVLNMPSGYERAFIYNLAIEIAPEYGKQASATVVQIAAESKLAVESSNSLNDANILTVDNGLTIIGDVYGDNIYDI